MASRSSELPRRPETAVDLQQFISVAYDLANNHMEEVAPLGGPGSTVQSDVEQLIKKIQYNMAEMGRLKEMHTLVIQLILFRREEIGKQLEQLKVLAESWKEPNFDMGDDTTHGWEQPPVLWLYFLGYATRQPFGPAMRFWTSMRLPDKMSSAIPAALLESQCVNEFSLTWVRFACVLVRYTTSISFHSLLVHVNFQEFTSACSVSTITCAF